MRGRRSVAGANQKGKLRNCLGRLDERLLDKFEGMFHTFKTLLNSATPQYYTPHNIEHSHQVEEVINRLVPERLVEDMSAQEIYLLLMAIYLHDVGMSDQGREPRAPGQTLEEYNDEARRKHSLFSSKYIQDNHRDLGLTEGQADVVSQISLAHSDIKGRSGQPNCLTFRELIEDAGSEETFIEDDRVRVHFLAALLRLGDELDVDQKRTGGAVYEQVRNFPPESKLEWMKHSLIQGIDIDSNRWSIRLHVPTDKLEAMQPQAKPTSASTFGDLSETQIPLQKGLDIDHAENNRLVTEVSVKLRTTMSEVAPVFKRNDLLYRTIEFGDKIARQFRDQLRRRHVYEFGTYEILAQGRPLAREVRFQEFLSAVEENKLSPEFRLSTRCDLRIGRTSEFLKHLDMVRDTNDEAPALALFVLHAFLDVELFDYPKDLDSRIRSEKDLLDVQNYILAVDMAAKKAYGESARGSSQKRSGYRSIVSRVRRRIDSGRYLDRFLKEALSDNWLQVCHDFADALAVDLLIAHRRHILMEKLDEHLFIEVIGSGFFDAMNADFEYADIDRRKIIADLYKATLMGIAGAFESNGENFRLYCREGHIGLDCSIVAAEMMVDYSPLGHLVTADTTNVTAYYQLAKRFIKDPLTMRVQAVNPETGEFLMASESEEPPPGVLEAMTARINQVSCKVVSASAYVTPGVRATSKKR